MRQTDCLLVQFNYTSQIIQKQASNSKHTFKIIQNVNKKVHCCYKYLSTLVDPQVMLFPNHIPLKAVSLDASLNIQYTVVAYIYQLSNGTFKISSVLPCLFYLRDRSKKNASLNLHIQSSPLQNK